LRLSAFSRYVSL